MGVTYKAQDINLECPVALKVINAACFDDERKRKSFISEARAAARLRHRNVASVHYLGSDEEHFFYAMEFIEGESAEALVKRTGPLDFRAALRITLQVARALAVASREHLIHRDIKPANLMILSGGEEEIDGPTVKVIDFGLVRCLRHGGPDGSLAESGFSGTPQFASPEQIQEGEVDIRSDIYSLGCTLWYLLTGSAPFTGSMARVFADHLNTPPPLENLKRLPKPVLRLIGRMLKKNPAERPQDANVLRREIENCLAALDRHQMRAGLPLARAGRWLDERPRLRAAALACSIAALALPGAFLAGLFLVPLGESSAPALVSQSQFGSVRKAALSGDAALQPAVHISPEVLDEPEELLPIAEGPEDESTPASPQTAPAVESDSLSDTQPLPSQRAEPPRRVRMSDSFPRRNRPTPKP
jgi:serine/threonine protein kinase